MSIERRRWDWHISLPNSPGRFTCQKFFQSWTNSFLRFSIDTLKTDCDHKNYVLLLSAFDFQQRKLKPTRATPKSKTCTGPMILHNEILTETIESTLSDHYSGLAKLPKIGRQKKTGLKHFVRTLKTIKDGRALTFLFLLDRKLRRISLDSPTDFISEMFKSKMECFNTFAPEQPIMHHIDIQWITNSIQMHFLNDTNRIKSGLTKRGMTNGKILPL